MEHLKIVVILTLSAAKEYNEPFITSEKLTLGLQATNTLD
jgi:hypothetical protein